MAAIGLILAARPIVEAELIAGKEGGGRRKEESRHLLRMHHEKKKIFQS